VELALFFFNGIGSATIPKHLPEEFPVLPTEADSSRFFASEKFFSFRISYVPFFLPLKIGASRTVPFLHLISRAIPP